MNHKFQFTRLKGTTQIDAAVNKRRTDLINTLPDGDYEIIIRKQVKWDVDKMRKYFHGVVLDFIKEQFKGVGHMYGKPQIKDYLKTHYGPTGRYTKPISRGGQINYMHIDIPKSTSEYSFDIYTKFLKDINAWCIECFQCELPTSDEVE